MRYAKLLVAAVALLTLAAVAYAQPPKALTPLKGGIIPIIDLLATFAAVNNGNFEAEGLKLELVPMAGGAVTLEAVAGGSLHFGYSAYDPVLIGREKGLDFTVIAPSSQLKPGLEPYVSLLVLEESDIRRPKDADGKKFALNTLRGINQVYSSEWISRAGGDPGKVIWVELPFPAHGAALRAKRIDIMIGVEPFLTMELRRGGVRAIGDHFSEVDPKMVIAGWVVTESWARRNPDLVERFVRAFYKGVDFVNSYPEKRAELMVKFLRIPPDIAPLLKTPGWVRPLDLEALQRTADLNLKWGLLTRRADVKQIVWPTALK